MTSPLRQVRIADYNLAPYAIVTKPVFAKSKAYQKIFDELLNYTIRNSKGGSVLISGHRGSGKTTLVRRAIDDLTEVLAERQLPCKPLFVPLHGPDLLDPAKTVQTQDSESIKQGDTAAPPLSDANKLIKNVLEHLTISLYRSLANEFCNSFREKLMQGEKASELKELVGLLRLELDEGTDVSVLRSIWAEAGFLETGTLFNNPSPDQGVREIALLSSAAQAYRIVTGSITAKQGLLSEIERELSYSSEYKFISKDIINAIFGLLSGAAVGAGVVELTGGKYDLLLGSLAGIATAVLSTYTFTLTSKGTAKKKRTRDYQFIRNTDISTLNRDLPNLINRMKDIGLAPIFIVDELDKVIPPYDVFGKLINYLKNLVTDHSFFCFLTDRNYFDFISDIYQENKYPVQYTYFSNRFYVNYSPRDLHAYLDHLFQLQMVQDKELKADAILLQYMLLNRSSLHTIDLKREIKKRMDSGFISVEGVRSNLYFRFPIMIQLAIESILQDERLVERFEQDSYFFQSIVDTMYYPIRMWFSGEELNVSKKRFEEYLKERSEFYSEEEQTKNGNGELKPAEKKVKVIKDTDFLLKKLNELVELLLDGNKLYEKLNEVKISGDTPEIREIWKIVIDTIPKQIQNSSVKRGLLKKKDENSYEWRFDYYGRPLKDEEEAQDLEMKLILLLDLQKSLKLVTNNDIGLENLASFGIINTSPSWHDLQYSIPRIKLYTENGRQEYPERQSDLPSLDEYYGMIVSNGKTLAKALTLAHYLKAITGKDQWKPFFDAIGQLFNWRSPQGVPAIDKILSQLGGDNVLPSKKINWDNYAIDTDNFQNWLNKFESITNKTVSYSPAPGDVYSIWWTTVKKRLLENIKDDKVVFETTVEDLICISENYRWAKELKDISSVYKRVWSDILVEVWNQNPATPAVPRWLIVPSLIKLGFTSLEFKNLNLNDKEWEEITPFPEAKTLSGNEFIIFVSQRSMKTYFLPTGIGRPFLIFDYDLWHQQTSILKGILSFVKDKYVLSTLFVETSSKDADETIDKLKDFFGTNQDNTFLLAPFGEVKSKFKVVRSVTSL